MSIALSCQIFAAPSVFGDQLIQASRRSCNWLLSSWSSPEGYRSDLFVARDQLAFYRYLGGRVYAINSKLRKGEILNHEERILAGALDDALARSPKYLGTVYRGVPLTEITRKWLPTKVGEIVTDAAFGAASTDLDVAVRFAGTSSGAWSGPILAIESRSARLIGNELQKEVVFRPGPIFRLTGIEDTSKGQILHFDEIERPEPSLNRFVPAYPWTAIPDRALERYNTGEPGLPNRFFIELRQMLGF